jgi:hypothetical protein
MVIGTRVLRALLVFAGIAAFAYLYGSFMADTWHAHKTAPKLDATDVKIATALAGALGAVFAVAMGIKKQDHQRNQALSDAPTDQPHPRVLAAATVGEALVPNVPKGLSVTATIAVWLYPAVGVAAAITWWKNKSVSPDAIKNLAEVIGGYVLALIGTLGLRRLSVCRITF